MDDGRRTVVVACDHISCASQRGTSAHRSPVSTPSIEMKCTPPASTDGPRTAIPSTLTAASTSGPVSICSVPAAGASRNP
jgi:hypothetical protein